MSKLPRADKELGQHFLRDKHVIEKITQDFRQECDVIIEVGPGPAVLTEFLAKHEKPLYIIEKDTRFSDYLDKYVLKENQFIQDALKFNWNEFITKNELENKKIWLVSNLPYNVGTVLFTQFLTIPQIQFMSLMFQKEVGEKTFFREVKNQMNGLLFLSQNYFNSKQLIKVSPGAFVPPPKVDSVVVSYTRKSSPALQISEFPKINKFTRLLFSQKRKQIGSVLKSSYDKELLSKAFEKVGILTTFRAEVLSCEQITSLYHALNSGK
jgi:16S rRNA (adenine1518-N6/adenine1519-N6)-dimethyltransferase